MLSLLLFAMQPEPDAHQAQVRKYMEAERAFSKMGAEKGFRESFLHFFAPDGIGFNPEPHVVRDVLSKDEPEKLPLSYEMSWEPMIAGASLAGDIGFTTGPFLMKGTADRPPVHMAYFSIWKRMPNGDLRVALDLGTPMKEAAVYPKAKRQAVSSAEGTPEEEAKRLEGMESLMTKFADLPKTMGDLYSEDLVAYRIGVAPLFGGKAAVEWHEEKKFKLTSWEVRKTTMAAKADFAWTWGRYEGTEDGKAVAGYWVHVWLHEKDRGWRIAADVMSKLPAKA